MVLTAAQKRGYKTSKEQDPLELGLDATLYDILAKYQAVLAQTGKEQEEFFSALSDLRLPHQETHWLDHTITQLQDEIWRQEQDKLLVDDQVKQQTQASLSLKEEIQRLEEQNLEDRVRIQRLLSLAQPTGEDVTILLPAASTGVGLGGFGLPRGGAAAAAAAAAAVPAAATARRRTRQGQEAAGAAAAATAAGAAGKEGEDESNDGSTEAAYKRKQSEWIARALKSEKDPRVALALEGLQSLNHSIAHHKSSYEPDVLELQRRRALREAEAAEVLSPLMKEGEETVRRMEEQERGMSEDIQNCLKMIVEGLGDKAAILNEHARLAKLQKVVAARVRTFHARVAKRGQVVLEEERARVEKEVEGEGERLREELVGIEEEIREVNERFAQERPRMEQKLRVLQAALERRTEGLSKEKRRYRLDKEGWENEVRMLAAAVMKAKRLEEKLRVERRAAAVVAARERAEEEEMRMAEEGGEGGREEEEGEEEEEEEEDNLEELDDLMFQLELLMSKEEEGE